MNNVETLACVTRILERGPATFAAHGTAQSTGTKLLSICGDVRRPGVYEVPFGVSVREVLAMANGRGAASVQLGGPSGRMIGEAEFDRRICFDDLATGGAVVIFGPDRNPVEIAKMYTEFFEEESCGYCTPCRLGNVLLRQGLERVLGGRGEPRDLEQLVQIGATMKAASRCGLGQTSPNPVLTSLESFRGAYDALVEEDRSPINDLKDFSSRCAVGLIEGGCANVENVSVLRRFRENCDVLVSVGDCATMGGVPALRNMVPLEECLREAYVDGPTVHNPLGRIPDDEEIPLLLNKVYPAHEVVKIDYHLPGCPPSADTLWVALTALLSGEAIDLPYELIKYD